MANIRLFWLCLSSLVLHGHLANAACEDKCKPISDLLSKCSLPPLSTDFNSVGKPKTRPKNGSFGPATYFIDSVETASCFCSTARDTFDACTECFDDDDGGRKQNDAEMTNLFLGDCNEWGYFVNKDLSYPSTTRDTVPSATASPSSAVKCNEADVCGIVRNQIAECGLTSFDDVNPSKKIEDFYDELLVTRRDAECFCTKKVLNRLSSCSTCLGRMNGKSVRRDNNIHFGIAREYSSGCFKLGYYADDRLDLQSQSAGGGGASKTSDGGAGAKETDKPEEDAAAMLWDAGIIALLGVCCAMSVGWSFI